jgi:hypothetical protein
MLFAIVIICNRVKPTIPKLADLCEKTAARILRFKATRSSTAWLSLVFPLNRALRASQAKKQPDTAWMLCEKWGILHCCREAQMNWKFSANVASGGLALRVHLGDGEEGIDELEV